MRLWLRDSRNQVEQVTGHKSSSRVSALHGQFSRNKLSIIGVANDDTPASETLTSFQSSSTKDRLFGNDGVRLSGSNDKGFFIILLNLYRKKLKIQLSFV
jgi:hypothetical protein